MAVLLGWRATDKNRAMTLRTAAIVAALGLLFGLSGAAFAQTPAATEPLSGGARPSATAVPAPGPGDPRIREITYDPNQVVQVRGHLGFEMAIEFDPEERIENVSIGDSLSWQVTPNRKATMLFIKPMAKTTPTSMTVVTSKRIYSFLLSTSASASANDAEAMLRLRFHYPAPPKVAEAAAPAPPPAPDASPEMLNFGYSYTGAKQLTPARVFDDGKATYFQFVDNKDVPAVFVLGTDGKEEMANTRISGRYTVADFTAQTFVLRYGKARLQVRNTAWSEPAAVPKKGG